MRQSDGRFHDLAASHVLLTLDGYLSFHDLTRPHCPVFQDTPSLERRLIGTGRVRLCARTLSRAHETAESPSREKLEPAPDEDNDAENGCLCTTFSKGDSRRQGASGSDVRH